MTKHVALLAAVITATLGCNGQAVGEIVRDAEYLVLEAQNGERWAADDAVVDQKLAEFRDGNGGKPPNFLYILIDDIGFGDLGIPESLLETRQTLFMAPHPFGQKHFTRNEGIHRRNLNG